MHEGVADVRLIVREIQFPAEDQHGPVVDVDRVAERGHGILPPSPPGRSGPEPLLKAVQHQSPAAGHTPHQRREAPPHAPRSAPAGTYLGWKGYRRDGVKP
ncbi:hypothetical protein GCM10010215_27110 [Streptomyces virginiae]|uniref:Uncharacterized protein n=1 Tax=Streptomyces virginiae TaxID=1961 RepID=A0ABQ3NXU3_STRVG|nr:hypothetical protein GCM10010215_27110 [Streptomyces virginiae]GHI17594.1 hypothetical protein Scinn_70570 [Streptomyces virginiae]GLV91412.1 hypothetical protein Slala04_28660 [Streptomyces lavendulae subsp. lavendulae]